MAGHLCDTNVVFIYQVIDIGKVVETTASLLKAMQVGFQWQNADPEM